MTDEEYFRILCDEELMALKKYKENNSFHDAQCYAYHINDALLFDRPITDDWQLQMKLMDGAIQKFTSDTSLTLYRATFLKYLLPFKNNDILYYKAYMSTAIKPQDLHQHFASSDPSDRPVALVINCPPRTAMALMEGNREYGLPECERLLPRGSRFRVISSTVTTDKSEIIEYMGMAYSIGVNELKKWELEYITNCVNIKT